MEFFDALSNAEKQVGEYRTKFEELNQSFVKAGLLLSYGVFVIGKMPLCVELF